MLCCLNPACHNPSVPDGTKYCPNCHVPLVILRNRYRPVKSLGGGGFGKTYLAEDTDKLDEKCVIKQFAPQVQETAALQKATELFEEEAKRLQQLGEHPQIPTLLAYFQEDSRLYLVQQFIDGQNLLKELQQQGTFSEGKIRDLLQDLLNILQVVHQQKVIHRDIKPDNIIQRGDGKIVLIDFGASKQLTKTVMTAKGTTIGTFGYAPLEQMQDGKVYPASDLYSLGATCFHLLSGIHPWQLWKSQGYGWVRNWRQHLQQAVSEELGQILDKLLQEEYQQRYQSVGEVLQDLNFQPVIATPVSPLASTVIPHSPASISAAPQGLLKKLSKQNFNFRKILLLGAAVTLVGTQIYGYVRYGLLPTNPISIIASIPSGVLLQRTLKGHSGGVFSVAISPDGKTLASGSNDGTIKLWNIKTGEQIRSLRDHFGVVWSVAISQDGKTLASGSNDGTIKLWNIETGEQTRIFTGHSKAVFSVVISPGTKFLSLFSGSADNTIKEWVLATGEQIDTLTGHSKAVFSVAINRFATTLASGSNDNTIKLWNRGGKEIRTLTGHSDWLISVAFSPDGETLVSGSRDHTIKLWNIATGKEIRTLTGHSNYVNSVAISPDGNILASGSFDKTIKLWNLATGELIRTLTGHSASVRSVAFSPDGKTLVSSGFDKTIKIWRLK
ncbi:serine/threonine-protein kinase [Calothrix sp. UHCC 0171]|uniref:serine/threonine-protein kinase n=1 Tax=Calothrix sp. UHCC 0171 TaxID=3110245 RepID=UPI002B204762|nr:serine/threonine-protein kinase [Calothrix sp. UHCC 0171]MEA5571307.1 serine/threonine-protein kinase [Calothrix sp. UHCC 0171]